MEDSKSWKNLPLTHNLSISFESVGSRILLISPNGNLSLQTIRIIIDLKKKFLEENNMFNESYIELYNFRNIKGFKRDVKKIYLEHIKKFKQDHFLLCTIGFNAKPAAYWFSKAVQFHFRVFGIDRLFEYFSEAETYALKILYKSGAISLRNDKIIKEKEAFFSLSEYKERISFINNSIIYSEIEGPVNEIIIKEHFRTWEELLKKNLPPQDKHCGIVIWKKTSYLPMRFQRLFITELFKFTKTNPCHQLYFIPENRDMEKLFSSSKNLYPVPLWILPDFFTVLKQINQIQAESSGFSQEIDLLDIEDQTTYTQEQINNYILEFTDFLSTSIDIPEKDMENYINTLSIEHPFRALYKSASILIYQYNERIQNLAKDNQKLSRENNDILIKYLLYKKLYTPEEKDKVKSLLETLAKIPAVEHVCFCPVDNAEDKGSLTCSIDIHKQGKESIIGMIIPPALCRFIRNKAFYAATPEQLLSAVEDRDQKPYLHAFIKKRDFGQLITFSYDEKNQTQGIFYFEIGKSFKQEEYKKTENSFYEIYKILSLEKEVIPDAITEIKPIDLQTAISEFDNSQDFLFTVLRTFFSKLPEQLEKIKQLIRNNDSEQIRKEAHKLKGGFANLFAEPSRCASEKLEIAAKNEDLENYTLILNEITAESEKLKKYLSEKKNLEI